jgi:hypothetical protein
MAKAKKTAESPLEPGDVKFTAKEGSSITLKAGGAAIIKATEVTAPEAGANEAAATEAADPIAKATAALDKIDAAVTKVRQSDAGAEIIVKALRDRDDEIERLAKRVAELEALPAPSKTAGSFISISKEQDVGGAAALEKTAPSTDDIAAALGAMSEEERAILLIKAAQRLPRPATMRPTE